MGMLAVAGQECTAKDIAAAPTMDTTSLRSSAKVLPSPHRWHGPLGPVGELVPPQDSSDSWGRSCSHRFAAVLPSIVFVRLRQLSDGLAQVVTTTHGVPPQSAGMRGGASDGYSWPHSTLGNRNSC